MKRSEINWADPDEVERCMQRDIAEIHFENSLKFYEREWLFNILLGSIGTAWFVFLTFAAPLTIFLNIALAGICMAWTISGIVGWRSRRTKRMMMELRRITVGD